MPMKRLTTGMHRDDARAGRAEMAGMWKSSPANPNKA